MVLGLTQYTHCLRLVKGTGKTLRQENVLKYCAGITFLTCWFLTVKHNALGWGSPHSGEAVDKAKRAWMTSKASALSAWVLTLVQRHFAPRNGEWQCICVAKIQTLYYIKLRKEKHFPIYFWNCFGFANYVWVFFSQKARSLSEHSAKFWG